MEIKTKLSVDILREWANINLLQIFHKFVCIVLMFLIIFYKHPIYKNSNFLQFLIPHRMEIYLLIIYL
jgi:hypothetical protein